MDSGFLLTSGGTALISALLIQAIKKSQKPIFSWFGTSRIHETANLWLSIAVAFITAIGIGYKYDGAYDPVSGVYNAHIALTGITLANILHGVWHWFVQWIEQHFAYKIAVVPTELQAANIDVLNQLLDHLKIETTPVSVEKINPTAVKANP